MGIIQGCSDGCFTWIKGYNQKVTKLRQLYRSEYKNTIFYQICINFVEQLHILSESGHGSEELNNSFKGSLIDSIHYEQSALIAPNDKMQQSGRLPSRISSLTQAQKMQLISELIKKSYIFLDISDIFSQQQSQSYQRHIKHKIFQNDDSITDSFMERRDYIIQSLRKFNTETIFKLQNYVNMCESIKKCFDPTSDSLLSKFNIMLKSKVIEEYHRDQMRNIGKMFRNVMLLIRLLEDTVAILFDLRFNQVQQQHIAYPQESRIRQVNQSQEPPRSISAIDEKQVEFLNQTNYFTLISSILFDEAGFHQFFQKSIQEKFANQLKSFKKQSAMNQNAFIARMTGQSDEMQDYFQPIVVSLFKKTSTQAAYFQKTTKMFSKLVTKYPPILKLKLLAQVQKQFLKQLKLLCTEKGVEMVYDRMASQLMASWLINRDKSIGERSILSLVIAYAFVHPQYRLGGKGSIIISYVQTVEMILNWAIPTQ